MTGQIAYKLTEGEQYVEDFFQSFGIEYECQKKIVGLKKDTKFYRVADFYLPKFKVYVEFYGLWNNSGNQDYSEKKEVYKHNGIPCVYLYPENLGILEYSFDKRIQQVLEYHKMENELNKYKRHKMTHTSELKDRIIYILIAIGIFGFLVFEKSISARMYAVMGAMVLILAYQMFCLWDLYQDIYKRNKYSLGNLFG